MKISTANQKIPAQKLLAARAVKTTGAKQGTKYHVGDGCGRPVSQRCEQGQAGSEGGRETGQGQACGQEGEARPWEVSERNGRHVGIGNLRGSASTGSGVAQGRIAQGEHIQGSLAIGSLGRVSGGCSWLPTDPETDSRVSIRSARSGSRPIVPIVAGTEKIPG